MPVLIFAGPSLPASQIAELLPSAIVLEPARCGDIYRACALRPRAIALIDGYFEHALSVWHKEILWALSRGVRVYGAASMGALRAAELDAYGMIGVGAIYEAYRGGLLEDDDEVAVVHEPSAQGFLPRSEAMVNIRATLCAAKSDGAIASAAEAELVRAGKELFYPQRTFETLLEVARLSNPDRERFRAWLEHHGRVDQKRLDARALLESLSREWAGLPQSAESFSNFHFEITDAWQILRDRLDAEAPGLAPDFPRSQPSPADLDISKAAYEALLPAALERATALLLAQANQASVEPREVQLQSEDMRRALGLLTPRATNEWLDANGLDIAAFSDLAHDEVLVRRFAVQVQRAAMREVRNILRLRGDRAALGRNPLL